MARDVKPLVFDPVLRETTDKETYVELANIDGVGQFAAVDFSDPVTATGDWTFTQPITVPAGSVPLDRLATIPGDSVLINPTGIPGPVVAHVMANNSVLARVGSNDIAGLQAVGPGLVLRTSGGGSNIGWGAVGGDAILDTGVSLAKLAADVGTLTSITTNTSGTSIRFQLGSLGIQLCFHTIDLGSRISNGSGTYTSPYRANTVNWTFPESFSSTPVFGAVTSLPGGGVLNRAMTISCDTPSSSGVTGIAAYAVSDSGTDVNVIAHLWAIGTFTP